MTKKITLAIETAVGNGSLSIFENDFLLDEWTGEGKISRSDRLLPVIAELLDKNGLAKRDLSLIAVSRGPGSFTGSRIGLATAIGLKNGLDVPCLGISILHAVARASKGSSAIIAAVLTDRKEVVRERFAGNTNLFATGGDPMINLSEVRFFDDFINEIKNIKEKTEILLEGNLFDSMKETYDFENTKTNEKRCVEFKNIGSNLSFYIGKAAIANNASDNLNAVYTGINRIYLK
jgi:tRNA threonylcarbamoyl adenosine modification protein YeaZ